MNPFNARITCLSRRYLSLQATTNARKKSVELERVLALAQKPGYNLRHAKIITCDLDKASGPKFKILFLKLIILIQKLDSLIF